MPPAFMKILKLEIHNIGPIGSITIDCAGKPLILLYGEIRQGKSTILNAVRWCLGGSFPTDIIKHGATEAFIQLTTDSGWVRREFYVGRDGTNKAREVVFMDKGAKVANPVAALKAFLNPFLINQDHLRNMNEPERKRFFVELFGLQTDDLDVQLSDAESKASALRSKLTGYGEIDLTSQASVDTTLLNQEIEARNKKHEEEQLKRRNQLSLLRQSMQESQAAVKLHNQQAQLRAQDIAQTLQRVKTRDREIAGLLEQVEILRNQQTIDQSWLAMNKPLEVMGDPVAPPALAELESLLQLSRPDISELQAQLLTAAAQNVRAEQYQKNLARQKMKEEDQSQLAYLEKTISEIRKQKISRLATIASECKIPGIEFDAAGNLTYEGTQAGMLSTSQVMKLSAALSSLYPEGFGLDLIDRAESLGKSIFEFIDKAKREDKTILATIVGDKPATVPAEVGVFVIQGGSIVS
jgi:DNA repair ATPase RecN